MNNSTSCRLRNNAGISDKAPPVFWCLVLSDTRQLTKFSSRLNILLFTVGTNYCYSVPTTMLCCPTSQDTKGLTKFSKYGMCLPDLLPPTPPTLFWSPNTCISITSLQHIFTRGTHGTAGAAVAGNNQLFITLFRLKYFNYFTPHWRYKIAIQEHILPRMVSCVQLVQL